MALTNNGTHLAPPKSSLPLNGAKVPFQGSALTIFGVFITVPNAFGPPLVQLSLAVICVGALAFALIGAQHHNDPVPVKRQSNDPKL